MTLDEMRNIAKSEVAKVCPGGTDYKVKRVFSNIMDGTLVTVEFISAAGKEEDRHIHFQDTVPHYYKSRSDVFTAIGSHKERNPFFRLLSMVGVGGLIALVLILVFGILLCVLAFSPEPPNPSILEIIKLSFTLILGFFFGNQTVRKETR